MTPSWEVYEKYSSKSIKGYVICRKNGDKYEGWHALYLFESVDAIYKNMFSKSITPPDRSRFKLITSFNTTEELLKHYSYYLI